MLALFEVVKYLRLEMGICVKYTFNEICPKIYQTPLQYTKKQHNKGHDAAYRNLIIRNNVFMNISPLI